MIDTGSRTSHNACDHIAENIAEAEVQSLLEVAEVEAGVQAVAGLVDQEEKAEQAAVDWEAEAELAPWQPID